MDCRPLTEITGEANFEPLAKYLTILPKRQLKVVLKLSADQHDFQLIVLRYFNPVRFAGGRKKKKSCCSEIKGNQKSLSKIVPTEILVFLCFHMRLRRDFARFSMDSLRLPAYIYIYIKI